MTLKKVFIVCSVRDASPEYRRNLEEYADQLCADVHLPHLHTDQTASGLNICKQNREAITIADEVHVFYSPTSQGTHFDLGVAFALEKKIIVVENGPILEGKSFPRMLLEWEFECPEWDD